MNKYLSEVFFHFVGHRDPIDHAGNYAALRKVLNSGQVRTLPSDLRPPSVRRDDRDLRGWGPDVAPATAAQREQ